MFDRKVYDDLAKKLSDAIPEKFKHFKEDTEKTFATFYNLLCQN